MGCGASKPADEEVPATPASYPVRTIGVDGAALEEKSDITDGNTERTEQNTQSSLTTTHTGAKSGASGAQSPDSDSEGRKNFTRARCNSYQSPEIAGIINPEKVEPQDLGMAGCTRRAPACTCLRRDSAAPSPFRASV